MLILFMLTWIIFNGAVTGEILAIGAGVSILLYVFMCFFMDFSFRKDLILVQRSFYFLKYLVVLIVEILKANVDVLGRVISMQSVQEPVLVSFRTTLKSKFARVILANSITLTPGTITVSLKDDILMVHCLDKSLAEGLEDSVFVKMLTKMERIGG
ncbi:MAG: Na+/H+ antiporter subunit E [Eubacteriales bacterium]|nr:Na+/H+ antiporter subunit E [Eubacteriales bacterium]